MSYYLFNREEILEKAKKKKTYSKEKAASIIYNINKS